MTLTRRTPKIHMGDGIAPAGIVKHVSAAETKLTPTTRMPKVGMGDAMAPAFLVRHTGPAAYACEPPTASSRAPKVQMAMATRRPIW